jgi:DNA-binding transcriptional ArsR family regulator
VAQGERTVERLAECTGLSVANVSQHLQHLRRAGLVTSRRQAKFVFYSLAGNGVLDMRAALHAVAERNVSEVDRILRTYFHERDELEPVSRAELLKGIKGESVIVLDVRPEDEFALGHITGARNVPLSRLKRQLSKLDRNTDVVAYCRGPYCVMSFRGRRYAAKVWFQSTPLGGWPSGMEGGQFTDRDGNIAESVSATVAVPQRGVRLGAQAHRKSQE